MPADDPADAPDRRRDASPRRPPNRCPDPLEADFGPEPVTGAPEAAPGETGAPDEECEPEEEPLPDEGPLPYGGPLPDEDAAPGGAWTAGRPDGRWPGIPPPPTDGIFPGVACAGDACLLKPFANLFGRFGHRLVRGHGASLSRVAFSGIEFMKALRDFLDEEIALAEKAARASGQAPRYEKIRID